MDENENLSQENAIPELTYRGVDLASEAPGNERADTNTTSNASVGSVVARIENILMHIVDALHVGEELAIVHTSRRSRHSTSTQPEMVRYPGRNLQESVKFARILVILQLSHDALVSGTVLTKRHIFYQHQNLFDKQSQVDDLVDDIAFNMGVSRGNLNIVAASKGVLAGPLIIRLNDGSSLDPCSGDMVSLLYFTIDLVLRDVGSCYSDQSVNLWRRHPRYQLGSGRGKGRCLSIPLFFPILENVFVRPWCAYHGLFDYDPDGVKILRCYRYGSERLSHETCISTQTLQWLGVKSNHLFRDYTSALPIGSDSVSQSSRVSMTSTSCRDPVSYLSARERAAAISTLKKMEHISGNDVEVSEMRRELQLMLTLGVKAEIEWLDESGDLCSWLDGEITGYQPTQSPHLYKILHFWHENITKRIIMAPKLTEDEIDDLIYFSRAGEQEDLTESIKTLAERENASPAEIVAAAQDASNKSTCLHMATGNGHLEIVRQLIQYFDSRPKEQKQAFLDESNEAGNTGMHWAALGGHLDVIKLLLEQGASPALANEQNYVPLDLAYFNHKNEVAEYFLSTAKKMEDENQEEGGLSAAVETVEIEDGEKSEEKKETS
ncbi:hypothetical protein KAF25_003110 [Fusarium avenaceum]|uniref:DNA topoisomerase (ATP-hydrolyzing) n=1 Tax=Fusarium avenaceum TaxID=40199 RepID=A0A9P7H193_9HYPO|nr:hypothetical protein KAF25_003110 [Fusarium avenaceum]